MALSQQLLTQTGKKASPLEMGAMQSKRTVFLNPFVHRRTAEAEDSLESWVTNGTLPQQCNLECVRL